MKTCDSDPPFLDLGILLYPLGLLSSTIVYVLLDRGPLFLSVYWLSVLAVIIGGTKVFRAKLPLYRQGIYLTLGFRSVQPSSRPLYVSGWRWIASGGGVAALLLLTRILLP